MPKTRKMMEMVSTKKTKTDESHSSTDLSTTTSTSEDTKEKDLMNVMSGDFNDIRPMPAFVDKTMLLKTIMQKKYQSVCLIAPRKFGKSVNLSMLKRFWEVLPDEEGMSANRKIFEDTKIAKECPDFVTEHCGKYPVILLDFLCSKDQITCYGSALEILRMVVHEAYSEHVYLISSDELDESQKKNVEEWCDDRTYESLTITSAKITSALKNLAKYLQKHYHQQVIVLVDEYDCVCSNAIMNIHDIEEGKELIDEGPRERRNHKATDEITEIITLCMRSIGCLLKSNENVFRGVLTGISYLTTMGLSTLTVNPYRFQEEHDFTRFYGITSDELKEVLSREKVSMEFKYSEIKKNFNGYRGDMLSIWSVMNYLNDNGNREDKNYWKQSGVIVGLDEALKLPAVRSVLNKLLSSISNVYEMDYFTKTEYRQIKDLKDVLDGKNPHVSNVNIFFNFILEQGYLKSTDLNVSNRKIIVQVPNNEIRSEFREKLILFYTAPDFNFNFTEVEECAKLFDKLTTSNKINDKVLKNISKLLNRMFSRITLDVQNEATLHHLIFIIIFFSSKFRCFSEIRGAIKDPKRLDLLMLNTNLGFGIIIELKYNGTAKEGLKQIIVKNYCNAFKNPKYNPDNLKIEHYLLLGVNMSENKNITLCALFDCKTLKNCVNY